MQEVHLTSGIPFCFYRYPVWVYDIPFWFVKELIVGPIQFNKIFIKPKVPKLVWYRGQTPKPVLIFHTTYIFFVCTLEDAHSPYHSTASLLF